MAREVSARFKAHPEIFDSEVRVTADKVTRRAMEGKDRPPILMSPAASTAASGDVK